LVKKSSRSQQGVPVVLMVTLIAVVLAAGALAIYNGLQNRSQTASTAQPEPAAPTPSPTTSTSPTPAADAYLHIKELGIKIRLTEDIEDAVYGIAPGDPLSAKISSQSLINLSSACKPGAVGPLGTVGKTKNPDQGFGVLTPNNETVFKFDNYYVYYQSPQSPCGDSQAVEDLASKQRQSFAQAFKTVQPD
jgi:hypothetical protein